MVDRDQIARDVFLSIISNPSKMDAFLRHAMDQGVKGDQLTDAVAEDIADACYRMAHAMVERSK